MNYIKCFFLFLSFGSSAIGLWLLFLALRSDQPILAGAGIVGAIVLFVLAAKLGTQEI
jgi:hypothetical protein